ncbi:hypothetical protein G6F59_016567 [Rhizopus arrhizus]|nr:hypothetical protein G6F59_016567 [Rhizopus arrhizus]
MMVGGHATSSTLVIKHMTTLPSMHHRIDVLTTRFCLRSRSLPGSCLLSLLSSTLPVSRIKVHLDKNPLWQGQKIGPGDRWPQLSSDLHETPNMHSCTSYHL